MNVNPHYLSKLKYIVIPFSIVAWSTMLAAAAVRWWLFMGKVPVMEVSEDTWQFWIPAILPWIPIFLWLKPRFDRLEFKVGKG